MKRIGLVAFLVFALGLLGGCSIFLGPDGKVYGEYDWNGSYGLDSWGLHPTSYAPTSGFPSGATYLTKYEIQPGSYYFWYQLDDGTNYYPGPGGWLTSDLVATGADAWYVSYTVTANPNGFFTTGAEKDFLIYLDFGGPQSRA